MNLNQYNIITFMNRILIITSYVEGSLNEQKDLLNKLSWDYLICADGGYKIAQNLGLKIDLVVGDFDSSKGVIPTDLDTIVVPVEKDDTDLQLALKLAVEKEPQEIWILGGIGGRVDHTIGNIQNIVYYSTKNRQITLIDPYQSITVHHPGTVTYKGDKNTKFSAFAFTKEVTGVTYSGAYYPLENHTLNYEFPLGISNEFLDDEITVTTNSGILIIVRTTL